MLRRYIVLLHYAISIIRSYGNVSLDWFNVWLLMIWIINNNYKLIGLRSWVDVLFVLNKKQNIVCKLTSLY